MFIKYVAQDNFGNVGQKIPFVQGESRTITVWLRNENGTPFVYTGTLEELFLKIYANISVGSIAKKFSLEQVTPIEVSGPIAGIIGFEFSLLPADTVKMAANNSGLAMSAFFTDDAANVLELDFQALFDVGIPAVQV